MVPVSSFLSRLLPNVIGCPEPVALQALVDSCISFCEQSLVVQSDLDPVALQAGVSRYELDLPTQSELCQVLGVWADDKKLSAVPSAMVTQRDQQQGTPLYYYNRDIDESVVLHLAPIPDKTIAGGLVVRVATRPTRSATQVHSSLFREWADVIVSGAQATLHDIPGQVFTNEAKAMVIRQHVRAKTNLARLEALRGRAVSSLSVTMRGF